MLVKVAQQRDLEEMGPGLCVYLLILVVMGAFAKKNVMDMDDRDMEELFQQWEENDDEAQPDMTEPQHLESNKLDGMMKDGKIDPEGLLKESKKGKPVMIFVGVRGAEPDQAYTEQVSARWMQSLHNAHIQVQRYVVAPDRVLFMVDDGSLAWDVKTYLTSLTDCTTVSFEQLSFDCKDNKKEEL